METIIVNLCAGPGAGKSTMAAEIFAQLKWHGVNCELATEYAKDRVWQEDFGVFQSQPYIFGKQHMKLTRLLGKVDVIVTDSPLIFSVMYDNTESESFKPFVLDMFNKFNNLNYVINRLKPYNPKGRMQNLEQAMGLDENIVGILKENKVPYREVLGSSNGTLVVVHQVLEMLRSNEANERMSR